MTLNIHSIANFWKKGSLTIPPPRSIIWILCILFGHITVVARRGLLLQMEYCGLSVQILLLMPDQQYQNTEDYKMLTCWFIKPQGWEHCSTNCCYLSTTFGRL